ncbi:MAG: RNA 2',3'-cyclic phosphodiesterase [Candidatus Hydrogenedentes bacterium]|nr:RNA 2',3'-cyclic phosphodiesterase [Candidatus Hydrogenedentota bacterium]
MRAFVAIEIPEEIRMRLLDVQQNLRESRLRASWVKPGAMHLTLRFLGEIGEADAETYLEHVAPAFAEVSAFDLTVRGVGAFPNARRPTVVWAGVTPADGALEAAFRIAEAGAVAIGQKPENRRFHPHVTLARIKDDRDKASGRGAKDAGDPAIERLAALMRREQSTLFGAFTAKSVSLFSSDLRPQGPVYTCIKEFSFPT